MGISEPVLEEEGSLIAGWRAKFGEENHQVVGISIIMMIMLLIIIRQLYSEASGYQNR